MIRKTQLAIFLAFFAIQVPVAAQSAKVNFHAINMTMVDKFIVPGYREFADAAAALDDIAQPFCAAPGADGFEAMRQGFHAVMDRWQQVQHIGVGPVTFEMRRYRIQLWPDKRGNVGRHLRGLLESGDRAILEPVALARGSVALQGLSALEQLLFADDASLHGFSAGEAGDFRCAVVTAITRNLASMAARILSEWTQGRGAYQQVFSSAQYGNAYYESAQDLSARLLRDLRMALQLISEYKLARTIGGSPEKARPRRAESWRSARSLENIRINLESVRDAWRSGFAQAVSDDTLRSGVEADFELALEVAAHIDRSLVDSLDEPAARDGLIALLGAVNKLVVRFIAEVPANLDLNAGMVSLDGD